MDTTDAKDPISEKKLLAKGDAQWETTKNNYWVLARWDQLHSATATKLSQHSLAGGKEHPQEKTSAAQAVQVAGAGRLCNTRSRYYQLSRRSSFTSTMP
jgi:hypothetical protein